MKCAKQQNSTILEILNILSRYYSKLDSETRASVSFLGLFYQEFESRTGEH
jgi:hypothetical protein